MSLFQRSSARRATLQKRLRVQADGDFLRLYEVLQALDLVEMQISIRYYCLQEHPRPIASICPKYVLVREQFPGLCHVLWPPARSIRAPRRRGGGFSARGHGHDDDNRGHEGSEVLEPGAAPMEDDELDATTVDEAQKDKTDPGPDFFQLQQIFDGGCFHFYV